MNRKQQEDSRLTAGGEMPRSGVTLSRPYKTNQVLERQRRQAGSAKALGSKVKVKVAQSCLTLFNPMNYVVLGIQG